MENIAQHLYEVLRSDKIHIVALKVGTLSVKQMRSKAHPTEGSPRQKCVEEALDRPITTAF